MAKIIPLVFYRNCLEVIDKYKTIFDVEIFFHGAFTQEVFDQMDIQTPPNFNFERSTIHATIGIYGARLHMADHLFGELPRPTGMSIGLHPDSMAQVQEIYERVQHAQWTILTPLEKQFWGDYFTRFVDEFGIDWQMNFNEQGE